MLGDQQDFVAGLDIGDPHDEPVLGRRRDIDDADAAARLDAVFVDFGALAETALRDRQQRPAGFHDLHPDDEVVAAERNAANTVRRPAHRPDVRFVESNRIPVPGADEHFAVAVRQLHGEH